MVKSDRVMLGHEIEKHSRDAVKDDFAPAEREDLFTLQPEGNTTKGKYEYKIGKSFIKIIQSSLDEVLPCIFQYSHVHNLCHFT